VAILPTGAVEAHGPHLPTSTDRVIALAMADEGARRLAEHGYQPIVLPPIDYTAASFATSFPGTVSVSAETVTSLLVDIASAIADWGVEVLAFANAHFDPAHLGSLYAARKKIREADRLTVIFPDVTRKPWALRLTDEFKSGACHAGQYEGSVVMARRPELVREGRQNALSANPSSLSTAIQDGKKSFAEAGGPEAYFGNPAAATAAEGEATIAELGAILEEAVLAAVGNISGSA
jgi:creatinine amidohydrolase